MAKLNRAKVSIALTVPFAAALFVACSATPGGNGNDEDTDTDTNSDSRQTENPGQSHMMPPFPGESGINNFSAPAGAKLIYNGGPVLPNVQVWTVFWNASVPSQASLNQFYTDITSSAYFDWLTEYNTPSQQIGHGSLAGSIVDTGAPAGSNISDASIQAEISRLINAGKLPQPNANTLFMMYFPAGVSITMGGSKSCVQFCAYHGSYSKSGTNVYYGVIPDLSGGCANGCGGGTKLQNTTSVSSHEMIEAVTDPDVGQNDLAWYDNNYGEIGDICNAMQGTVGSWTIQLEYSNQQKNCIATKAGGTTSSSSASSSAATTTVAASSSSTGGGNTCKHNICQQGSRLKSSCDPCVTAICQQDSYCCLHAWDSICVGEVGSICGEGC